MLCLILILGVATHDGAARPLRSAVLLRLIDKHISFAFVRGKLKESYIVCFSYTLKPESTHQYETISVDVSLGFS
jgi:hypothetical protein